jgi:hypothetical protein
MAVNELIKLERLLWLLLGALAIVSAALSLWPRPATQTAGKVAVLMPVYSQESLASDPRLMWMGLGVVPGSQDASTEGRGFNLMEGLSGTAYFGPTLGPEEVALGLLLLDKEPNLRLLPAQKKAIRPHVELLVKSLGQVHQLANQSGQLSDSIACDALELVADLPEDLQGGFPDEPGCPMVGAGEVDLWKKVLAGLDKP